uniref:Uncharacterized protein MANES_14G036700 n=1 Tax=Rhizophora mucronata TaxID=61149 RepID=A0A2P2PKH1_RHIMU
MGHVDITVIASLRMMGLNVGPIGKDCSSHLTSKSFEDHLAELPRCSFASCSSCLLMCPHRWRCSNGRVLRSGIATRLRCIMC